MKTLLFLSLLILTVFTANQTLEIPTDGDCTTGFTQPDTSGDTLTITFAAAATWANFQACLADGGSSTAVDVTQGPVTITPPANADWTAGTLTSITGAGLLSATNVSWVLTSLALTAAKIEEIHALSLYQGASGSNSGALATLTITYQGAAGESTPNEVFESKANIDTFIQACSAAGIATVTLNINYFENCAIDQSNTFAGRFADCQELTTLTVTDCVASNGQANMDNILKTDITFTSSQNEAFVNTCFQQLSAVTHLTVDLSGTNLFTTTLPTFPSTAATLVVDMSNNGITQTLLGGLGSGLATLAGTVDDLTLTLQGADPATNGESNVFDNYDPLITVTAAATTASKTLLINVWVAAAGAGCEIDGTKIDNGSGTACSFGSKVTTYLDETNEPSTLMTCTENYTLGFTYGNEVQATPVVLTGVTFVLTKTGDNAFTAPTVTYASDAITIDLEAWNLAVGDYVLTISDSTNSSIDNVTYSFTLATCKSIDMTVSSMKVCEDIVLATDASTLTPTGEDITNISYTWAVTGGVTIADATLASITIPKDTLTVGTTYTASLTTGTPELYVASQDILVVKCTTGGDDDTTDSSSVLSASIALVLLLALLL